MNKQSNASSKNSGLNGVISQISKRYKEGASKHNNFIAM